LDKYLDLNWNTLGRIRSHLESYDFKDGTEKDCLLILVDSLVQYNEVKYNPKAKPFLESEINNKLEDIHEILKNSSI
jgi:hypothetical protein